MDDRVRIVSDEEFIAAVVDRACDMAFKGQADDRLPGAWSRLCDLPRPRNADASFWDGFVLGGAIVGLDVLEFGKGRPKERLRPDLYVLKGGRGLLEGE